jgi:hypothetical protein
MHKKENVFFKIRLYVDIFFPCKIYEAEKTLFFEHYRYQNHFTLVYSAKFLEQRNFLGNGNYIWQFNTNPILNNNFSDKMCYLPGGDFNRGLSGDM